MTRAVRALDARPGFSIAAIATLALGLGVNTAVFSLTRTVLLRPLPYRDGHRLVQVNETNIQLSGLGAVAPVNYLAWRDRVTAFEDTTYFRRVQFNVSTGTRAVQVEGFFVAPNFFPVIGIDMSRGRGFAADASQPGRDNVVILGDGFWRRVFDADPAVVGRTIAVNGAACTIAGVLPPSYRIFRVLNREVDLYRPLVMDPTERAQSLNVWAKLKPEMAVETADAQLKTAYATLPQADGWSATAWLLERRLAAGPKPALVALEWAVAFVLLIACANVANLVLAASAARRTELAVRQALGAGRWRIARDLGAETLLVVAAGSALALAIAIGAVDVLNTIVSFQDVNRLEPFRVDGWVLAFAAAMAGVIAMVFGLLPARTAGSIDIVDALKETSHGATAGPLNRRLRTVLIVAEVALAMVLAVAAVAMTRSANALHDLARGVATDGVMTAQFALNDPRYGQPEQMVRVTTAIVDRLTQSPAIETAAVVNYMPLSSIYLVWPVAIEGVPPEAPDRPWLARYFVAGPRYLHAAGIPLIVGRDFTAADDREHAGVAIVSEAFARRFWNTTNVIGRRITPEFGRDKAFWVPRSRGGPLTVVGVAGDVREDGRQQAAAIPQVYVAYAQHPTVVVTLVARATRGRAETAIAAMRAPCARSTRICRSRTR